jgi:hypothetical protein
VLSTLSILFIQNQPIDHHDPAAPPTVLWRNHRFIAYLGVVAFAVFAMYLPQPLTPNFVNDVRGFSLSSVGVMFTMGALGNALLAVILSRFHPYLGYVAGQVMVAAFAFLIWQRDEPAAPCARILPARRLPRRASAGAGAGARTSSTNRKWDLTYGVMETVSAVIFILTPPLAGFMYKIDPATVYPFSLGLLAVSVLISLIVPRRLVHA